MTSAPSPVRRDGAARTGLVLAGILLLAMNLRASITSVGPVLGDIRADLGLGGAAASFLVALPVIGFAVVSPFAPVVARRVGLEWTLGGSLLVLAGAIVLRSVPVPGAIWVGTALLGAAIAVLNVLIPALVKREYPDRVGAMTGIYSAAQGCIAAIAAGLAVPIAGLTDAGWRLSIGVWAGLALIGFAVFLPQLRRRAEAPAAVSVAGPDAAADVAPDAAAHTADRAETVPTLHVGGLWRTPLAWWVTLYLGLQSTVYYTVITWWPAIESDSGLPAVAAGWHQFVFQALGIAGSLIAAALLHRMRAQSALTVVTAAFAAVAMAGQLAFPALDLVWVVCVGLASGGSITIALSLFGLRTRHHDHAASLSGMAQSVGYLLAAFGPILVGVLHDATGSWDGPLVLLLIVSVGIGVVGALAGRPRFVEDARR
ncbi:CynX/NimT family MFS transporter [Microbacterium sp.]|uniref:CynX/NimT family MFS transporter n=1 Tax=Microbacterium sp. TaxID=51671 RepID=UPI003A907080